MRLAGYTVVFILTVMGTMCAALASEHVFLMHSPINPDKDKPVTFMATATDTSGIVSITISVEHFRFENCDEQKCSVLVTAAVELPSCPSSPCVRTVEAGFPGENSHIRYWATVDFETGPDDVTVPVNFAAGGFTLWPDDPIPIYVQRDQSQAVDLIFIPDEDYGSGGNPAFEAHVANLIDDSFFSTSAFAGDIRRRSDLWNFYLTFERGDVEPPSPFCDLGLPSNWPILRATVDTGLIVHNECLRDCAIRPPDSRFSAEPIPPPTGADCPSTDVAKVLPVHEASHAVFSLADEYAFGSMLLSTLPHHNVFESKKKCHDDANQNGWPKNDCKKINPKKRWRSDKGGDLMKEAPLAVGHALGRLDKKRYDWKYGQCELSNC